MAFSPLANCLILNIDRLLINNSTGTEMIPGMSVFLWDEELLRSKLCLFVCLLACLLNYCLGFDFFFKFREKAIEGEISHDHSLAAMIAKNL